MKSPEEFLNEIPGKIDIRKSPKQFLEKKTPEKCLEKIPEEMPGENFQVLTWIEFPEKSMYKFSE